MKEIIINVPDDAVEFVEEFVERIGGNITEGSGKSTKQKTTKRTATPKLSDIFGTWPDIELDPKTYRKILWGKKEPLL